MDLQIALDRISLGRAVELTMAIAPHADWVEVGTSLIKRFGEVGLSTVVEAAGATPVLADLKTVDDVDFELALAYDCGARSATVMGFAPDATIDNAVGFAAGRDRELVIDLMGLSSGRVATLAARLPTAVVLAAHASRGTPKTSAHSVQMLGPWTFGRRIALAGGLTVDDLPDLMDVPNLRVIVGAAVTTADDPVAAVRALRRAAR